MFHQPNEDGPVTVWTIYREPEDYPGSWVVRGHEVFPGRGLQAHSFCFVARTLGEARAKVPAGARRFRRAPTDHPVIHECWVAPPPPGSAAARAPVLCRAGIGYLT